MVSAGSAAGGAIPRRRVGGLPTLRAGSGRLPLVLAMALLAPPVAAQDDLVGAVPLNELIEVMVVDREMLAFDGVGTKTFRERLQIDEQVLFEGERGAVGVIFTTRRALAATSRSEDWQQVSWRLSESIPSRPLLGDRLALFATGKRVLGFYAGTGVFIETDIGPNEELVELRAGANSGIAITDRRVLGISPQLGGFFDAPLRLHERIESVNAGSNLATITTSQRILVFRAASGTWSARDRPLR